MVQYIAAVNKFSSLVFELKAIEFLLQKAPQILMESDKSALDYFDVQLFLHSARGHKFRTDFKLMYSINQI